MTHFPRNQRHSLTYYETVLRALLAGLTARHRQAVIAENLNRAGIPAATGAEFTTEAVKAILKRLRHRTGPVWHALLELTFEGKLTQAQARQLLQTL